MHKELFKRYQKAGFITRKHHPENPDVVILNYTDKCLDMRAWDPVTLACRGLIYNEKTGEVLARPLDKFFETVEEEVVAELSPLTLTAMNYTKPEDENGEPIIPETFIKYDGSLGISYKLNDTVRWSTRGSFTSNHAKLAQEIWNTKYIDKEIDDTLTLCAEIIHPDIRVIVDYKDMKDLVLLAVRKRITGEELSTSEVIEIAKGIGMPYVEPLDISGDVQGIVNRMDHTEEGYVLKYPNGYRVKVKSPAWMTMFRLFLEVTESFRYAFHRWTMGTLADDIKVLEEANLNVTQGKVWMAHFNDIKNSMIESAEKVVRDIDGKFDTRKELAHWAKTNVAKDILPIVYNILDDTQSKSIHYINRFIFNTYVKPKPSNENKKELC